MVSKGYLPGISLKILLKDTQKRNLKYNASIQMGQDMASLYTADEQKDSGSQNAKKHRYRFKNIDTDLGRFPQLVQKISLFI